MGRFQPVGRVHLVVSMKVQRGDNSAALLQSGILTNSQGEMVKRKGIAGYGQCEHIFLPLQKIGPSTELETLIVRERYFG